MDNNVKIDASELQVGFVTTSNVQIGIVLSANVHDFLGYFSDAFIIDRNEYQFWTEPLRNIF